MRDFIKGYATNALWGIALIGSMAAIMFSFDLIFAYLPIVKVVLGWVVGIAFLSFPIAALGAFIRMEFTDYDPWAVSDEQWRKRWSDEELS